MQFLKLLSKFYEIKEGLLLDFLKENCLKMRFVKISIANIAHQVCYYCKDPGEGSTKI